MCHIKQYGQPIIILKEAIDAAEINITDIDPYEIIIHGRDVKVKFYALDSFSDIIA